MTRERLIWLLSALGFAAAVWWISTSTEWVEEIVARPARGEARDNPVYAFEQLLRKLGMKVERHEALATMPPEDARLVLLSNDWDLVPGRADAIHQWVLRGGHLVLLRGAEWDDTRLETWVPVYGVEIPGRAASAVPPPAASAASAASAAGDDEDEDEDRPKHERHEKHEGIELRSSVPVWGVVSSFDACNLASLRFRLLPKLPAQAAWTLHRPAGNDALRVPLGKGSVTVLNMDETAFRNASVLRCDNGSLLAAAMQAEPGATLWIYLNEKREALIPWLWAQGWIVIVAGLLALAAGLWRGALRFGPRMAAPAGLRRSIAEQVRGLGAYLHREGREALLLAQQRALDEAAARHIPGYRRLPLSERGRAIAKLTALPAESIADSLQARQCSRAELPAVLQQLETARRLLQRPPEERRTP